MTGQQPEFLTFCPDCEREIGVTQDKFNRTGLDANVWRAALHKSPTRPRCTFARAEVHPNNVWRNERRRVEAKAS